MLFSMVQSNDNCLVMRRGACATKLRPRKKLRKHSGEPGMLDYSRLSLDEAQTAMVDMGTASTANKQHEINFVHKFEQNTNSLRQWQALFPI